MEKNTHLKEKDLSVAHPIWVNKKGIINRYEGININTLNKWLGEMRNSQEFYQYVLNPTHKLVWISLDGFQKFLEFKNHKNGF
jgi:hypothetical protein